MHTFLKINILLTTNDKVSFTNNHIALHITSRNPVTQTMTKYTLICQQYGGLINVYNIVLMHVKSVHIHTIHFNIEQQILKSTEQTSKTRANGFITRSTLNAH